MPGVAPAASTLNLHAPTRSRGQIERVGVDRDRHRVERRRRRGTAACRSAGAACRSARPTGCVATLRRGRSALSASSSTRSAGGGLVALTSMYGAVEPDGVPDTADARLVIESRHSLAKPASASSVVEGRPSSVCASVCAVSVDGVHEPLHRARRPLRRCDAARRSSRQSRGRIPRRPCPQAIQDVRRSTKESMNRCAPAASKRSPR